MNDQQELALWLGGCLLLLIVLGFYVVCFLVLNRMERLEMRVAELELDNAEPHMPDDPADWWQHGIRPEE